MSVSDSLRADSGKNTAQSLQQMCTHTFRITFISAHLSSVKCKKNPSVEFAHFCQSYDVVRFVTLRNLCEMFPITFEYRCFTGKNKELKHNQRRRNRSKKKQKEKASKHAPCENCLGSSSSCVTLPWDWQILRRAVNAESSGEKRRDVWDD